MSAWDVKAENQKGCGQSKRKGLGQVNRQAVKMQMLK